MTASIEASTARRAPRSRVPDFFIVGHPKSGTTALYEMLRRRAQIHMPVKEPWFFAPDRLPEASRGYPDSLEHYLSLFEDAAPDQLVGEASPSYLVSGVAAQRIAAVQPDARIIAILREPAAFLRSLHLQFVQDHVETETDLGKAIGLEELRRQGKEVPRHSTRPKELLYSEHVRYVEQLRRYLAVFAPEQVLVLAYEDFRRDSDATVRQVLRFLEVDDGSPIEVLEANPTVRVRSRRASSLVRSLYLGRGAAPRGAKSAIKALTPQRLRHQAYIAIQRRVLWARPHQPDEQVMLELRRRFSHEVLAVSEYLDRDLVSLWGYDDIA
jgi:hypothetical protein